MARSSCFTPAWLAPRLVDHSERAETDRHNPDNTILILPIEERRPPRFGSLPRCGTHYTTSQGKADVNANANGECALASVRRRSFLGAGGYTGFENGKCGMKREVEVRGWILTWGVLVKSGNCVVVVYYIGFDA